MSVPLDKIINFTGNKYEMTNAVIRRARQITEIGDVDLEAHAFKVVSTALDHVLNHKVLYQLQD